MKRLVHANDSIAPEEITSNKGIVEFLNSQGIDTTKNKYELSYVFYGRYDDIRPSVVKFTCPGDYLALFSTKLAGVDSSESIPNFENIDNYFGIDYFTEIVDDNPTYAKLYEYANNNEWFFREEFGHIMLKNLTTNTVLVEDLDEDDDWEGREYDDDWED